MLVIKFLLSLVTLRTGARSQLHNSTKSETQFQQKMLELDEQLRDPRIWYCAPRLAIRFSTTSCLTKSLLARHSPPEARGRYIIVFTNGQGGQFINPHTGLVVTLG
jgi:hypothetical protein